MTRRKTSRPKALWCQILDAKLAKQSSTTKSPADLPNRSGTNAARISGSIRPFSTSPSRTAWRRLSPLSIRQRGRLAVYAKSKRQWWTEVKGQLCPVMLTIFKRQVPITEHPHHLRGRGGSLLCDTRFWLGVSDEGHRFIHANPTIARKHGWLCAVGQWNKPEQK